MARLVEENKSTRIDIKNIDDIQSVNVERKFGRPEDRIEIHIFDMNGNLLKSEHVYNGFNSGNSIQGLTNEINIDPLLILNEFNFYTGRYRLVVNILKRKIETSNNLPFRVSEISSTRTELKLSSLFGNTRLDTNSRIFIQQIQNSTYLRDFNLNFENNKIFTGVNLDIDKSDPNNFLLLVKTLKPIPDDISLGDALRIDEDIVEPINLTYDLGSLPPLDTTTPIKGPNFKIDTRLNPKVPTEFKSFNDILSTTTTSSYQKLV